MRSRHPLRPSALEEGEDNYFISLSDLMVGLLFIFLILFTFFALRMSLFQEENVEMKGSLTTQEERTAALQDALKKENLAVRARLTVAEETARQLKVAQDILTNSDRLRAELLRRIKDEADKKGIAMQSDEERGVLRLPNELLFDPGMADLKPRGVEVLGLLSGILKEVLQSSPVAPRLEAIFIEGHTDNLPIQTKAFPDNWALSTARALNTYKTLVADEPDLEKLFNRHDQSLFGVSGYGEMRSIGNNATDEGRRLNRRIDIRFVMAAPKFFAPPAPGTAPASPAPAPAPASPAVDVAAPAPPAAASDAAPAPAPTPTPTAPATPAP